MVRLPVVLLLIAAPALIGCQHLTYANKVTDVDVSTKRLVRRDDAGVELTLRRRGAAPPELVLIQVRDCVYAVDKTTTTTEEIALNGTGRAIVIGPAAAAVGIGASAGTYYLLERAGPGTSKDLGEPIIWIGLAAGAAVLLAAPTYNVIAASDPVVTRETAEEVQLHCSEERPTGQIELPSPHAAIPVENGRFNVAALAKVAAIKQASWQGRPLRVAPGDSADEVDGHIACAAVDAGSDSARDAQRCSQHRGRR